MCILLGRHLNQSTAVFSEKVPPLFRNKVLQTDCYFITPSRPCHLIGIDWRMKNKHDHYLFPLLVNFESSIQVFKNEFKF